MKRSLGRSAKPIIDKGHDLVIYNDKSSDSQVLKERVRDCDVLVIANSPLRREIIRLPRILR